MSPTMLPIARLLIDERELSETFSTEIVLAEAPAKKYATVSDTTKLLLLKADSYIEAEIPLMICMVHEKEGKAIKSIQRTIHDLLPGIQ
jgi:hypothetical protein